MRLVASTLLALSCAVVCLFLSAARSAAQSTPVTVDRVVIVDHGIYSVEITKDYHDANDPSGTSHTVTNIKLVNNTTVIPAQTGLEFGFSYKVLGNPAGSNAQMKFVTKIPNPGITNPATGETTHRAERMLTVKLGDEDWTGYSFDNDFEKVPGTWTWEIWDGDRKVAEQCFTVVAAH